MSGLLFLVLGGITTSTVTASQCQADRFCVSDDPPNYYTENKDYVQLSKTERDCKKCRQLCAARKGCTGYECDGKHGCWGWLHDACAKTEFTASHYHDITTCRMVGDMETDTSLCPMYVLDCEDAKCYEKDISTCLWKGCSTSARALDLSFCGLSGDLTIFSTLKNLVHLEVYNNKFTGSIAKLSGLTKLTHLFIDDNQLTGPIASLASLTKLTDLSVNKNRLTGPIPSSWCDGHVDCDVSDNPGVCIPTSCISKRVCNIERFCKDTVVVHGRHLRSTT